jgi:CheY-like chemotaxis protein
MLSSGTEGEVSVTIGSPESTGRARRFDAPGESKHDQEVALVESNTTSAALTPKPDTTGRPAAPAPVYYIVDDERVNLRVASRFMKTCGIPYETFEDGADLPKPLPSNVKAILLDIVMKRSDGVQVCRALRSGGCRVPIIAMTGNVTRGSIEQYKASGFNGVLSKPFTVGDIRDVGEFIGSIERDEACGDVWYSNLP